ncbi:SdpI family protein [Bacillus sp. 31A1R]|uniref:SdpI family protein n=1 Tax=Robertmurraya mangrovi TaxID=3098077 RepID=A0ABU5IYP3_9BACI|nr:SdpI family protein [Bacillus sp. 31A1R]MDZ5472251.1 SdpI family protein [Bacillus sp. 31A1R]
MNEGLVIGTVFLVAGIILFLFPPKQINHIYGYRTSNSMRNKENWQKANRYSSILLMIFGIFLLLFALIVKSIIFTLIMLSVSIALIFILVEMKIS